MELNSFFKDLKIVELSSVLAGPLAGSFFVELGANVYKIENKTTNGDVTRQWKLPKEDENNIGSSYYHSANFHKQVLMLDFNNEDDYTKLKDLIKDADVVITNFLKDTADKLKIGLDELKEINKNLIIVQLSAFGYTDNIPGFDLVMQAECGYISMCGTDEALAKMPVAIIDILASHQMKEAILIGLMHKLKTGSGSTHFVSLFKSGISGLINQGTNYLMSDHIAKPIGTLHPNIAPYGEIIETSDDKKIMLAIGTEKQFQNLMIVLGIKSQDIPERFNTNKKRVINRNELLKVANSLSKKVHSVILINRFKELNIPFAHIKNIQEVFENEDAQEMVVDNLICNSKNGKYIRSVAFQSYFA